MSHPAEHLASLAVVLGCERELAKLLSDRGISPAPFRLPRGKEETWQGGKSGGSGDLTQSEDESLSDGELRFLHQKADAKLCVAKQGSRRRSLSRGGAKNSGVR